MLKIQLKSVTFCRFVSKNADSTQAFTVKWNHTSFVCEQIRDPAQLLWEGAGSNYGPGDFRVFLDHPTEHHFAHVQIHTQTENKA